MKVNKAYKFRIYPTAKQAAQLAVEFGCARFVWNHALGLRQVVYAELKENMNYVGLNKHLTFLKKTNRYGWLKDASSSPITQKLIDLDTAYTNFFKGRAKFPKFKKKSHKQSIRYQLDQRNIMSNYRAGELLKLPKLGSIDIKWSQVPAGVPKMATVSKDPSGKYFISFSCEIEQVLLPKTEKTVGIDVGIKDVIITSDGYHSGAPRFTYKNARKLKHEQKKLSKKTKGSAGYKKQRVKVAKVHERIANSRRDFLNKETTKLIQAYDVICLEDLNVKGMLKNRKLSKAVADVGIFELNRQLKYKADWYGKEIAVISRWFPSTKMCSACGQLHDMPLSKRTMNCDCGFTLDRDENAAINIKAAGIAVLAGGVLYQPVNLAAIKQPKLEQGDDEPRTRMI